MEGRWFGASASGTGVGVGVGVDLPRSASLRPLGFEHGNGGVNGKLKNEAMSVGKTGRRGVGGKEGFVDNEWKHRGVVTESYYMSP